MIDDDDLEIRLSKPAEGIKTSGQFRVGPIVDD
jgi:hypothetical protein